MTKHRDVNDCRRQEKCKMAALIRLTSGYEMARDIKKERKKKKERTHGGIEEEKREKQNKNYTL